MIVEPVARGEQRHAHNTGNGEFPNPGWYWPAIFSSSMGYSPPAAVLFWGSNSWNHDELDQEIRAGLTPDVIVISRRLVPC